MCVCLSALCDMTEILIFYTCCILNVVSFWVSRCSLAAFEMKYPLCIVVHSVWTVLIVFHIERHTTRTYLLYSNATKLFCTPICRQRHTLSGTNNVDFFFSLVLNAFSKLIIYTQIHNFTAIVQQNIYIHISYRDTGTAPSTAHIHKAC